MTDHDAGHDLLPELYRELRAMAGNCFAAQHGPHTLQPTALVHEAWLRLGGASGERWHSRTHFLAVAARAMRQVLIDHARRRRAAKRGRHWSRVRLEAAADAPALEADLGELDEALERLAALHPRQARIVELRFLAGLTVEETASLLDVSPRTVKLDWRMARAWLVRELGVDADGAA